MGYDTADFYGEVPPDFICSICLDVMLDPVMLKTCQHTYCDYCIKLLPVEYRRCPQDRTPFDESAFRSPYPFFVSLHERLHIKCEFWPDCEERVPLKDKESHELQCEKNPLNNIVCQNYCGQKLTLATLDDHDCIEYFSKTIQQLKDANDELKKENDELQKENKELKVELEDRKSNRSMPDNGPARRRSKSRNTRPKVIVETPPPSPPQVTINYSKYGSSITSDEALRKLRRMVEVVQSFDRPINNGRTWIDSGLFNLISRFFEDNENAKNILILTDMTTLFNYEYRLSCFSNVFNKDNSKLLIRMLLFNIIEPLLNFDSKVLIVDFIEYGLTHLVAQKVQSVTTVTNPMFMDSLAMKNEQSFGEIASKIRLVPFHHKTEDLITKIAEDSQGSFDFILSFERYDFPEIKHLLRQLCPFGTFVGYNNWRHEIKQGRLTSNSFTGIELESDILVHSADFETLGLSQYVKTKNKALNSDDSSSWRAHKNRGNRLRSAKSNNDLSVIDFLMDGNEEV